MKLSFSCYVAAFLFPSVAKHVDAFIVANSTGGTDEEVMALARTLFGANGVEILNASLIGDPSCAGFFSNGSEVVPNDSTAVPDSGVILSSGNAGLLDRDRGSTDNSNRYGESGDSDLTNLAGNTTYDACILEIDFQCPTGMRGSDVMLNYVFASEDYSLQSLFGYVPGKNDVLGFFLNGENIAVLPLPDEVVPISVDTVNRDVNSQFFVDNFSRFNQMDPFNIAADGFTTTLTAAGPTQAGVNTIKLAIADGEDDELDSWVLLEAGTFTCTAVPSSTPSSLPSAVPSITPSSFPSAIPSNIPSLRPSTGPSASPSASDCGDHPCGSKDDKVNICHKEKMTLCVAKSSVEAHLNHGDHCGQCKD